MNAAPSFEVPPDARGGLLDAAHEVLNNACIYVAHGSSSPACRDCVYKLAYVMSPECIAFPVHHVGTYQHVGSSNLEWSLCLRPDGGGACRTLSSAD